MISHQGFVVGQGNHPGYCLDPHHPADKIRNFSNGRAPHMDTCHDCWCRNSLDEAAQRFEPITRHLGDVPWFIDQTGGMVMCLRLPYDEHRYILVSEIEAMIGEGELSASLVEWNPEDDESGDSTHLHFYNIDFWAPDDDDDAWVARYDIDAFGRWLRSQYLKHQPTTEGTATP